MLHDGQQSLGTIFEGMNYFRGGQEVEETGCNKDQPDGNFQHFSITLKDRCPTNFLKHENIKPNALNALILRFFIDEKLQGVKGLEVDVSLVSASDSSYTPHLA